MHGPFGKRDFLHGAARCASVGASASLWLEAQSVRFAQAQSVTR
jgi:hypothetical protein